MKSTNYYIVQGWMVNELQLKGNNLLIFAIIFGFSQDAQSEFDGSINYLAKAIGSSRNTVIKCLKELEEMAYVLKTTSTKNNVIFNQYSQNEQVVQKLVRYGAETGQGGSAETGYNNTITDKIDYNKLVLYFNKVFNKKSKVVHPDIKSAFSKRLKEGYSKEDILKVIDNCSNDKHHVDLDYKYVSLKFLSKPDIFERYASQVHKKPLKIIEEQKNNGEVFVNP